VSHNTVQDACVILEPAKNIVAYDINWKSRISSVLNRGAHAGKVPVNQMVLTFGKLQGAANGPKQIVPSLGIGAHAMDEMVGSSFMCDCVFVAVAVVIIHEASHVNL
jgi:hypothetical protein